MRRQDRRVKATTESLSNIKMLKMYAWTHIFTAIISERRAEELAILWKRMRISQVLITNLYFFPQILSAVVFSFYIGFGGTLDLDVAFTVITILAMIKDPLRALPLFLGQLIEFRVAMRRIQDYLLVEEVNRSMVAHVPEESTADAICIREGSAFHYGTSNAGTVREMERSSSQSTMRRSGSVVGVQRTASFTALYQPEANQARMTDSTHKSLADFLILK